jgi:hypothetical protein
MKVYTFAKRQYDRSVGKLVRQRVAIVLLPRVV